MSCEVVLTASMRLLILCLLTCVAYLVTFNIDIMWTRVLCCDVCVAMMLVYACFDAVNVSCGGSPSEPTESISKKRE